MTDAGRFANPDRAADSLPAVRALPDGEAILEAVLASADPDLALLHLRRFLDATGAAPRPIDDAIRLFASSRSLSNAAILDPDLLAGAAGPFPDRDGLSQRARDALADDPDDPRRPLRRFVRGMTIRTLLDDLAGRTDLAETTRRLTRIAEAAVDAALAVAYADAVERYGRPHHEDGSPAAITVLGFGKLGGEELNYSSDIDLVCLYSDEGRTDAADPSRVRRNREFFRRVVERMRALLADATPEGHCYRVDLRLRPEGSTGALVRTVRSALDYYEKSGRTWERQALIKARPVAGDLELGRAGFLEPVGAFVYDAPLRIDDIRQIQKLKREMERRAGDREVKAGPGGIRDVEFTVQFLQLLNGRRHPGVRRVGTLPALDALADAGALTTEERDALRAAYIFLRTAEHRVQTQDEVRTHRLPAHVEGIRRLARRMALVPPADRPDEDPAETFARLLSRHSAAARDTLDRLFLGLFLAESEAPARLFDLVLAPEEHADWARGWLAEHGFADPDAALASLERLATRNPRARKFLASLAPRLLLRVATTPDPDRGLRNLKRIVLSIGAPTTLYQLFTEHPDILGVFVDLSGWSQFLADLLASNPGMLDPLGDSLVVAEVGGRQPLDDLPLSEIEEVEDPDALLHDYLDLALVRVGIRDIQGRTNTRNTSRDLTLTAERILRLALRRVRADLERRFGPVEPPGRARLAVLGLGKLGAREMTWASDVDLVFVSDAAGATTEGLDAGELAARIAQGVHRLLTTAGPRGRLYEVDVRVRPWGRSGPLVTPFEKVEDYYRESAHPAELMMLTKARFVAGDEALGADVYAAIERVLWSEPPAPGLTAAVLAMRARLEERATGRDVKRGFGGIVDIEFLAEWLKLVDGHRVPALRTTSTLSALGAAAHEGILSARDHETLLTAYQFLRSVESRMRIVYDMGKNRLPEDPEELGRLARRLGYRSTDVESAGAALLTEYEYHTRRTREVYRAVLRDAEDGPEGSVREAR